MKLPTYSTYCTYLSFGPWPFKKVETEEDFLSMAGFVRYLRQPEESEKATSERIGLTRGAWLGDPMCRRKALQ